jgi:hypothetical protein
VGELALQAPPRLRHLALHAQLNDADAAAALFGWLANPPVDALTSLDLALVMVADVRSKLMALDRPRLGPKSETGARHRLCVDVAHQQLNETQVVALWTSLCRVRAARDRGTSVVTVGLVRLGFGASGNTLRTGLPLSGLTGLRAVHLIIADVRLTSRGFSTTVLAPTGLFGLPSLEDLRVDASHNEIGDEALPVHDADPRWCPVAQPLRRLCIDLQGNRFGVAARIRGEHWVAAAVTHTAQRCELLVACATVQQTTRVQDTDPLSDEERFVWQG